MYARAKVQLELAACYIEGRVDYTVELLVDMYQAELFGMIPGSYSYITTQCTLDPFQQERIRMGG